MPNIFTNVDFKFRYGNRSTIENTAIQNGSINIATDFGEVYIDVADIRVPINDVFCYDEEVEIRAIEEPISGKLYYSRDTHRFMIYDYDQLEWVYVTLDAAFLTEKIEAIESAIQAINSFNILVREELPEEGETHTIYFIPQSLSDEDTLYDEYVWIESESHFEKIGISKADLGDYYTKTEANELFASANSMTQEEYDTGTSTTGKTISPKTLKDIITDATGNIASDTTIEDIQNRILALETKIDCGAEDE